MAPKFHYCFCKYLLLVLILSQENPIQAIWFYFFNNLFNIILLSTLTYSKWSLSLWIPHQNSESPANIILLNFINIIKFDENCVSWSSSLYNFLHPPATSFLLETNSFISTQRMKTLLRNILIWSILYKVRPSGVQILISQFKHVNYFVWYVTKYIFLRLKTWYSLFMIRCSS